MLKPRYLSVTHPPPSPSLRLCLHTWGERMCTSGSPVAGPIPAVVAVSVRAHNTTFSHTQASLSVGVAHGSCRACRRWAAAARLKLGVLFPRPVTLSLGCPPMGDAGLACLGVHGLVGSPMSPICLAEPFLRRSRPRKDVNLQDLQEFTRSRPLSKLSHTAERRT